METNKQDYLENFNPLIFQEWVETPTHYYTNMEKLKSHISQLLSIQEEKIRKEYADSIMLQIENYGDRFDIMNDGERDYGKFGEFIEVDVVLSFLFPHGK